MRILLLVALAGFLGVSWSSSAHAQETPPMAPGQITGFVFHDLNGNGTLDAGEPGLSNRTVHLEQRGLPSRYTGSGTDGAYHIEGITAGEYMVVAEVNGHSPICSDGPFSFKPFPNSGCFGPTLPWHDTTSNSVALNVEDGTTSEINFGAQPADVAVVVGLALLEDDFAPPGTSIEAVVDGQQCGTATVPDPGGHFIGDRQFELHIAGLKERSGCATRGDQVEFIVGGVRAAETYSWVPFTQVTTLGGFRVIRLTALKQHAWYWMEAENVSSLSDGANVRAIVDGAVCGETVLQTNEGLGYLADPGIAGFTKLIVPSDVVQPGCGRPGAIVSFTINGALVASMPWQPGLQEVGPKEPTLPPTGSAGRNPTNLAAGLLALATAIAALGAGAVSLSLLKVARPHRR